MEESIEIDHRFYGIIKNLGVSLSIRRFCGGGEGGEERSGKRREQKERKRMAGAVRVVGLKKAKK